MWLRIVRKLKTFKTHGELPDYIRPKHLSGDKIFYRKTLYDFYKWTLKK